MKTFPFIKQRNAMDCGPTCIKIIAKHHGQEIPTEALNTFARLDKNGTSLLGISEGAKMIGLNSMGIEVDYERMKREVPLPCIAHWRGNHFIVIYRISRNSIYVSDPAVGLLKYKKEEFIDGWVKPTLEGMEPSTKGHLLVLEPMSKFFSINQNVKLKDNGVDFGIAWKYIVRYKSLGIQILASLLVISFLQLLFPFFTQTVIDVGIKNHDLHFVYLILAAQIMLFIGRMGINLIKDWLILHFGSRISMSMLSDFFIKLMKLPISYFDRKRAGDIMQLLGDHGRIQTFLTSTSINSLLSIVNLFIFGAVLAVYSWKIIAVFVIGSTIYLLWIFIWLKKRKAIDYKRFGQLANDKGVLMELINGMQEIKLNNAENQKRWDWENVQANLFQLRVHSLSLSQIQQSGALFINELKDIIITILSASLVIQGDITLGMLLAVSYITGSLNGPISQLSGVVLAGQDARISLNRLNEIHKIEDEEPVGRKFIKDLPKSEDILFENVCFSYNQTDNVLEQLNLRIPKGKITALVGASGCGKTTFIKLLLKIYEPTAGKIQYGKIDLSEVSAKAWRAKCGVVMQEGYIFTDTIANNIAIGEENIDQERLKHSAFLANINEFIESLPLGYHTRIGNDGMGISTGQKQRIRIARAIYKQPDIFFMDEATSSLDASNEREIGEKISSYVGGKTVIIAAHRLSTIKQADQILVMDKGLIVEVGNHEELIRKQGFYQKLFEEQIN